MQKKTVSTMLAAATILGSSMVGCSGASRDQRPALSAAQSPALAKRVEDALASRDYARALMQAEQLVAADPRNAGHRALLGRAYMANGRYFAARTAFTDAMTLGNRDPRTIVSLALCETGIGDPRAARDLLADHIGDLPAGDYGLAMALAGAPEEGVRALLEAVRQPEADSRTRQNLAYALALAGAIGQARLVAGEDLTGEEADKRVAMWSQDRDEKSRVIALVGVAPRMDDIGLPIELALNQNADPAPASTAEVAAPTRVASNDLVAEARAKAARVEPQYYDPAVDQPVRQTATKVEQASPAVETVAAALASQDEAEAPLIRASTDPMRKAVRAAFQRSSSKPAADVLVARADMSRIANAVKPVADAHSSDWVIQLGAYSTEATAHQKWQQLGKRRSDVAAFREVHSSFTLSGKVYHRLAIRGFGDRGAASSMCQSLRVAGQACFVRLDDTGTTRMARAKAAKPAQQQAAARSAAPSKTARQLAER